MHFGVPMDFASFCLENESVWDVYFAYDELISEHMER